VKRFLAKWVNVFLAISLFSAFSATSLNLAFAEPASAGCIKDYTLVGERCVLTLTGTSASTITIPEGLGNLTIELFGAAGGIGGLDCGTGCTAAQSGQAGHLTLSFDDLSGKSLNLYPGAKGADGASGGRSSGGGAGGKSSFNSQYDGGQGGNTGPVGTSGAGGGGGAATVVVINNKTYVAAGAGAGGGSANSNNGSVSGNTQAKYSFESISVRIGENQSSVFTAPAGTKFVSSDLRWESVSNSACGVAVEPDVFGKTEVRLEANNNVWQDGCFGASKQLIGTLNYSIGSKGGVGKSSSCAYFCDGAGGGGGGGGLLGGAGGGLYQAPNGDREAAGFGGSAGSNTPASREVIGSDYVDADGNGVITISYTPAFPPQSVKLTTKSQTNDTEHRFLITSKSKSIKTSDIELFGTAAEQAKFKAVVTPKNVKNSPYTFVLTLTQVDRVKIAGELEVAVSGVSGGRIQIDQVGPAATIRLQPETQRTASHTYDVSLTEDAMNFAVTDFVPTGTASGCVVGDIVGSGSSYQVVLDKCGAGTFGLTLKQNSLVDYLGNTGPETDITSDLVDQTTPLTSAEETPGTLPTEFVKEPIKTVFTDLSQATKDALAQIGIYAPMPDAPTVSMVTDISALQAGDPISYQNTQQVDAGSSIKVGLNVSPEMAQASDLVAFIKTGNLWQYLGRTSFNNNQAISEALGVASVGQYQIRLVVIPKTLDTANISFKRSFGKSLPISPKMAVTDQGTTLSNQVVELTIDAVPGPTGAPTAVEPTPSTGIDLLTLNLPTLNVGEPVANPAIGATGDDNPANVPF